METLSIVLSSGVSAGTKIPIPTYAKKIAFLLAAKVTAQSNVTHAACGATGAAYASATVLLAKVLNGTKDYTVVEGSPSSGQVTWESDGLIFGDDLNAGAIIEINYIPEGEYSGF